MGVGGIPVIILKESMVVRGLLRKLLSHPCNGRGISRRLPRRVPPPPIWRNLRGRKGRGASRPRNPSLRCDINLVSDGGLYAAQRFQKKIEISKTKLKKAFL